MSFAWLGQATRSALLVGDSLAVGLGPRLAGELESRGIYLTTRAEVGTNADQWRRRSPALFESLRPEIVLVSLGSNDAQSASLTSAFPDNVRSICDSARASGAARCALFAAPNRTASAVNPDGVEVIAAPTVELQSDGIHPTVTGYRVWAAAIASSVASPPAARKREGLMVPLLLAAGIVGVGIATFPRWRAVVGL